MFGFLLKKSFCDGWDNLFSLVLVNVLALFTGIGLLFVYNLVKDVDIFIYIFLFIVYIVYAIFALAYGEVSAKIADFCGASILDFFKAIPGVLLDALLFGTMCYVITILSIMSFDYYFITVQSLFGYMIGCMIMWIDILLLLAFQWFVPIRSIMHNNFRKCVKKCFILFFDNTGFTLAMGVYSLIMIVLSVVFIGFFPSMAGILIADTNALRLRLYKYDYLEEHPELKTKRERRNIPWEELLYDDKEALGPRKFKSFFMPWKEES